MADQKTNPNPVSNADLTKDEKKEQVFLAKQANVPVGDLKPKAAEKETTAGAGETQERTQQDEFNEKLRELANKTLELLNGAGSDKAEQVERVIHNTIKFAHVNRYRATNMPFDPITPMNVAHVPRVA